MIQFLPDQDAAFHALYATTARGGTIATTYQPRHRNPTREDAVRMADAVKTQMAAAGVEEVKSGGATTPTRPGDVRAGQEGGSRVRQAARMTVGVSVTACLARLEFIDQFEALV